MQINSVLHNRPLAPQRNLKLNQPTPPPPEPNGGDGWCQAGKAGAAVLCATGMGALGFQGGARAGMVLGLMLTRPGSGLGVPGLLGNVLTGLRVGAITGTLVGAAAGASLVYLISDAMQSQ